ncbi:hypothetical protein H5410_021493 [Solanum commersonii]|uniref:Uncharacterized protein n=1 Tax=Solanum commersonii TaxID=4109 RepID=A0A9J5ZFA4_SOLCO|nr:hypothetical protein H5410_021493 [Solanum commersonii]
MSQTMLHTRLNHECPQQYSTYSCKDQLYTQRLKFSSSTKVFKCPHTKNDSIFTHNGSII